MNKSNNEFLFSPSKRGLAGHNALKSAKKNKNKTSIDVQNITSDKEIRLEKEVRIKDLYMNESNKTSIKWNNVKSKVSSIDYGGNSIVKKRLDRIKKQKDELL